jgi:hypothetical protein
VQCLFNTKGASLENRGQIETGAARAKKAQYDQGREQESPLPAPILRHHDGQYRQAELEFSADTHSGGCGLVAITFDIEQDIRLQPPLIISHNR